MTTGGGRDEYINIILGGREVFYIPFLSYISNIIWMDCLYQFICNFIALFEHLNMMHIPNTYLC